MEEADTLSPGQVHPDGGKHYEEKFVCEGLIWGRSLWAGKPHWAANGLDSAF